jgi:outer membrane protein TolC
MEEIMFEIGHIRKRTTFFSLILICIFLMPVLLEAAAVTLPELLRDIQETHPFFAKESLGPEIERKSQEGYLGTQDWVVRSSPYYVYQEPVSSGLGVPSRLHSVDADIALERSFWSTGGRFSLCWSTSYNDQTVADIVIPMPTGDIVIPVGPSSYYTNKAYLTYTQPLLQNFGGKLDKLNYELSDYTLKIIELQARENEEKFILNIADVFLDWVLLTEQQRIAKERWELSKEQLEQVKRKRASYLVDHVDVLRVEDAVRIAEQATVLIESQLQAKRAELAVLCQSDRFYTDDPEFDIYSLDQLPEPDQAVAAIKEKSKILNALRTRRAQLEYLSSGYQETKRPQLYLSVGAGLQGGNEEFTESFELDKPDVLVALDFRYPLGNHKARADISKTELEIKQLAEDIKNIELEFEAGIRQLLITIEKMEEVLELNKEQIASARVKTNEEIRLYNQGRNLLAIVIQSRDNEEQAKQTYAQNAATYHKLILEYRALMDELLVK